MIYYHIALVEGSGSAAVGARPSLRLTATLGTATLVVLQQVQRPASLADRPPLAALPQAGRLLFGEFPEILGVAAIHLETDTGGLAPAGGVWGRVTKNWFYTGQRCGGQRGGQW